MWSHLKLLVYLSPVEDAETLQNRTVACFQAIHSMQRIWDRLLVAMRRRAEACIQAGDGQIEHLLQGHVKS
jgi:hypothetical protein